MKLIQKSPIVTLMVGLGLASAVLLLAPIPGVIAVTVLALVGIGLLSGLRNVRLLPYLLLFGLIMGQLLRLKLSDSGGALLVMDSMVALYSLGGLAYVLAAKKKPVFTLSTLFVLAFLAWMSISLVLGAQHLQTSELFAALFYVVRYALMLLSIYVTAMLFPTQDDQVHLQRSLITTGLILSALGYLQLVFVPDFAFMAKYGWDPHDGRLLSTFFDPNFFGFFLVIISSLLLSHLLTGSATRGKLVLWVVLAFVVMAIGLTFSRSTYLAFLIATFLIFLFRMWQVVLLGIFCVTLAVMSVPRIKERVVGAFTVDATAQDRIQSWQEALVIIRANPITGVGYNAFGPAQLRYDIRTNLDAHSARGSDSSFLLILATTGMIGFALYVLMLLSLWYEAARVYRDAASPFFKAIGLAVLGILPAYLLHSQFVNSLFYPLIFVPFGLLVASVYVGLKRSS